jgi:hypothetical protein
MEDELNNYQIEAAQKIENLLDEISTIPTGELLMSCFSDLQKFVHIEGFEFLSNLIEGVYNLNPDKRARKRIFLLEDSRKNDRNDLLYELNIWSDILSLPVGLDLMIEILEKTCTDAETLYKQNIFNLVKDVKEIEQAYRTLYLFYRNTEEDRTNYITIVNASTEQITNPEYQNFTEKIESELKSQFERIDLCENYSLLIIPGYLGNKENIIKWAKIAFKYKLILITDYKNVLIEESGDLIDFIENDQLSGDASCFSNVILCCNWLIGREKHAEIGESEPLFLPPSAILGGRMYSTSISQVANGKRFGELLGVSGTMIPLLKSELSKLRELNVVPMVDEWGKIMAFGDKTMYNGSKQNLQTYSSVRISNYLLKVLLDYCNRMLCENINSNNGKEFQNRLTKYLETKKWEEHIIEDYHFSVKLKDEEILLEFVIEPKYPPIKLEFNIIGRKRDEFYVFEEA